MGVAGLWDVLRPVGKPRALTHLAVVDGFETNSSGVRGFRVGIDASIWFYHATYGREGENPELRTLFFRCARLMSTPFLPLFVFDGPKRPKIKRGKRISGKDHWMVQGMQRMIDAFGFEWRMAPGEAEAELAYLNRLGVIDAVLSDDVDTFLFGATMVVRNPSATLSGNKAHPVKNSAGKTDDQHVVTYSYDDFREDPDIALTHGGLVLIGILRGGDYHQGLNGCGVTTAHGLAKCGFGDSLVKSARNLSEDELEEWLNGWREDVRKELRTNSRGFLGRKCPSLAKALQDDFPNVDVLLSYTNPITSESYGRTITDFKIDWEKEPDLGKIAGVCEMYFEWGVKEIIIKRFRTVIWPPAVLRILRRSALIADKRVKQFGHDEDSDTVSAEPSTPKKHRPKQPRPFGSPSKMIARHFSSQPTTVHDSDDDMDAAEEDNLIKKIHSSRTHASTDGVLEYRLEIAPAPLIALAESGIRGDRKAVENNMDEFDSGGSGDDDDDDDGKSKLKKPPPEPTSHLRVWMPACMVKIAEPRLVEEFEAREQAKRDKKSGKGSRVASGTKGKSKAVPEERAKVTSKASKKKDIPTELEIPDWSDGDIPVPGPSQPKTRVTTQPAESTIIPSGPSNTMDRFFKARKAPAIAKAKSATATVTSLFENFELPPRHTSPILGDHDDTDTDDFGSSLRKGKKPSQTKPSRPRAPPIGKSKSTGILSMLDHQRSPSHDNSRAQSQPVLLMATQARPFPMSLKSPPVRERHLSRSPSPIRPAIPNPSKQKAKSPDPTSRDSDTNHPKGSLSQRSSTLSRRNRSHPNSDSDRDGDATSSTLFRQQKSKVPQRSKPMEIIEISSDSDGPSVLPASKLSLQRTLSRTTDRTRSSKPRGVPVPSTADIIDLT
ncbi:hypothetical protein QCA50_007970 [Cerrena zonata]|uniref:XPG-I domain-containing protein n=1 Tax=Cerrena zonata TaxID=2478898 RepID=A0AAW0G7M3_9APHY